MGVNQSRVRAIYDADAAVLLRDVADGAETSTATETAVSLNELDTAFWQDGNEIPYGLIEVGVHITAIDRTTGDETYTFDLIVDDTSNMSDTPKVVASLTGITTAGFYTMYVDSKNIPLIDSDTSGTDKWIAIKATLGGTTPSVTYGAWMSKSGC
jgi:hypothetical protein